MYNKLKLRLQYFLGVLCTIPITPLLYYQGKQIRKTVPSLPEATGMHGKVLIPSTDEFQILLLGESTMAGVGVTTNKEGFSGSLARELAEQLQQTVSWSVYAKSGYNAKKVELELLPQIQEKSADLIVIGVGANDVFEVNTLFSWSKNVISLIRSIRLLFPETPIAFANMPPVKEFTAFPKALQFTLGNLSLLFKKELIRIVAAAPNVYFDDRLLALEEWILKNDPTATPADLFSDGVHPSKRSYALWAREFSDFLFEHINISKQA